MSSNQSFDMQRFYMLYILYDGWKQEGKYKNFLTLLESVIGKDCIPSFLSALPPKRINSVMTLVEKTMKKYPLHAANLINDVFVLPKDFTDTKIHPHDSSLILAIQAVPRFVATKSFTEQFIKKMTSYLPRGL